MLKIPAPRLLPATIAAMSALLMLKCGMVLVAVTQGPMANSAMVGSANAASTDETKEPAKAAAKEKAPVPAAKASAPGAEPASAKAQPQAGPPPITEAEKVLLQELRQRRQDLDARADAAAARDSLQVATEQKLTARVAELKALQTRLEGLDAAQKQKEDAGWQGLVKVYETMKPKEAATIFNDMSMPVLVQLMDRMKDSKAALVMAAMNPDKARDVTAELAEMRTGRDASGAPLSGAKNISTGG